MIKCNKMVQSRVLSGYTFAPAKELQIIRYIDLYIVTGKYACYASQEPTLSHHSQVISAWCTLEDS